MNPQKLLDIMENLNDDLILQALPARQESRPHARKTMIAAIAAALLLALAVGATAAGAPFFSNIFSRFVSPHSRENDRAVNSFVQEYAQPIEQDSAETGAASKNAVGEPGAVTTVKLQNATVSAKEFYFDGRNIFLGLELESEIDPDVTWLYQNISNLTINGESMADPDAGLVRNKLGFVSYGNDDSLWERDITGKYICRARYRVPEKYRDQDKLDIGLAIGSIWYDDGEENLITIVEEGIEFRFPIEKQNVPDKKIESKLTVGNVTFVSAVTNPAVTEVSVEIAADSEPGCGLLFEDGMPLSFLGETTKTGAYFMGPDQDGIYRYTFMTAGIRETETRKVVLLVREAPNSAESMAVYLLDFQKGTVEQGTAEDVVRIDNVLWRRDHQEIADFQGSHQIVMASLKDFGNELLVYISTTDQEPRDLELTIEQGGEEVVSMAVEGKYQLFNDNFTSYYSWKGEPGEELERNCYQWRSGGMEKLDPGKPALFRITDPKTDKVLSEETIQIRE